MKQAILAKRKSLITLSLSLSLVLGLPHFAYAGYITVWQQPSVDASRLLNSPYRIQVTGNALYYRLSGATTWVTAPNNSALISAVGNNWAEFVIVEQNMESITLKRQQRPNTIQYFTGRFGGFNFRFGTTQSFTIEQDGELNSGFAGSGGLTQGFESGASLIVQSPATINTMTNSGTIRTKTLIYGTINTLEQKGGLINDLDIQSGGKINTLNLSGGSIPTLSISSRGTLNTLTISGGILGNLNINADGSLNTLEVSGGTFQNLNLNGGSLGYISGTDKGVIQNINLNNFSIRLASTASVWNDANDTDHTKKEHLYVRKTADDKKPTINNINGNVVVSLAQGGERDKTYKYDSIVTNGAGNGKFNSKNVLAAPGLNIIHNRGGGTGFSLSPDVTTSYGAAILKNITLSFMRRATMTQNILDSMTTKSFRANYKAEQDTEYKMLKDDMARLTNRSSKYSKQQKRDQKQLDKMRDKLAKNTLRQSKGVNLTKGYNTYELIDQLDRMFISYERERNTRAFILPYGAHSTTLGDSTSATTEWAGGAIVGIQKNLQGKGVFGGYLGYEFSNLDNKLTATNINIQTNSLQVGANLFKTYPFSSKPAEWYLKSSLHASLEMPHLSFIALGATQNFKPLAYSLGADIRGGITHFFVRKNSYISPEIGLSYDMLSLDGFRIESTNESYGRHFWHFPQLMASVKYYKSWKNTFKTSATIGVKYNILHNLNKASFSYAGNNDTAVIPLPPLYANLDLSAIWVLQKNSELSLNYTGVFFAGFSSQASSGVSTAFSLRFAHWF